MGMRLHGDYSYIYAKGDAFRAEDEHLDETGCTRDGVCVPMNASLPPNPPRSVIEQTQSPQALNTDLLYPALAGLGRSRDNTPIMIFPKSRSDHLDASESQKSTLLIHPIHALLIPMPPLVDLTNQLVAHLAPSLTSDQQFYAAEYVLKELQSPTKGSTRREWSDVESTLRQAQRSARVRVQDDLADALEKCLSILGEKKGEGGWEGDMPIQVRCASYNR